MDEAMKILAHSLADAGPAYVLAAGAIALFVTKVWPTISNIMSRREDRADRQEQRMADYQRESAERDGKWLMVSEQSAKAMEGMTSQMQVLNATLQDSKERSRDMSRKVDEIHAVVIRPQYEGTD